MVDKKDGKQKVVAVKYDKSKDLAPRVVAKGSGFIADKIVKLASEKGVYLYEDAALVEVLSAVDLDQEIPEELYKAVAEVLVFIYTLENRVAKS
jgi:flagellar biosynthesis protein